MPGWARLRAPPFHFPSGRLTAQVRVSLVSFEPQGLVLRSRRAGRFTVAYGEILTAERTRRGTRITLHTRAHGELSVPARSGGSMTEGVLRGYGVRIVDHWGQSSPRHSLTSRQS